MRATPAPAAELRPIDHVMVAAACALATGLGELGLLAIRRVVFARPLWLDPQVVWMAPAGNLLLFLPVGLLAAVLAWRWRERRWLRLELPVLLFLSGWGLLLHVPRIAEWSVLLLAAGVAMQGSRWLAAYPRAVGRIARVATLWLTGVAALAGGAVAVAERVIEARRLATRPAAPGGMPNVLWIVLDTERAASLSWYGYGRPTSPRLAEFAASGVVFDMAIAPSSWSLPSHATMFTGVYSHQLAANWQVPLGAAHPTVAEALRGLGYATAAFVANTYYVIPEFGVTRGFAHLEDYRITLEEIVNSAALPRRLLNATRLRMWLAFYDILGSKRADEVSREALHWITGARQRPFFAFLNYFDTHEPYLPPAPFDRQFGATEDRRDFSRTMYGLRYVGLWPWRRKEMTTNALRAEQDAYDGTIASTDAVVGALLDSIAARGLLDSTLVIITSDHGEQFGRHRDDGGNPIYTHGHSLYLSAIRVPLLLRWPAAIPAGGRVPIPVSLRDLPATVWQLIGARAEAPFPGSSLSPLWQDGDPRTRPVSLAVSNLRPVGGGHEHLSIVRGRYHYIEDGRGPPELYDIVTDPLEQQNLAASPAAAAVLPSLRAALDSVVATARGRRAGS